MIDDDDDDDDVSWFDFDLIWIFKICIVHVHNIS